MDVSMDSMNPDHSPLSLDYWPFELFLHFVRFLDASDLLKLRLLNKRTCEYATHRSTWRILAEVISNERPIPVSIAETFAALANSENSNLYALIRSLTTASRVQRNWVHSIQPRLRKILVFQTGATKRAVDIAALLPPGSRYLVSTEYYEEEKQNRLTISDIHLEVVLGSWPFAQQKRVLAYRSVENGAAVMFLVHPGLIGPDGLVEYELVRFDFPQGPDELLGQFMTHSFFRQPGQLHDLSISEDLILILDVEGDNTVSFDILNWRTGEFGRLRTGIQSPTDVYNLNITGQDMALWVHSPTRPRLYYYPMSLIYHCLEPGVEVVTAPLVEPVYITFEDSTKQFETFHHLFSQRSRLWPSMRGEPLTDREMSVSQYWRSPSEPMNLGHVTVSVGIYRLPIPFDGRPLKRTWLAERTVAMHNPQQGDAFPFFDFNSKHGIFVEVLPNGERQMRFVTMPLPDEQSYPPEYFEKRNVKTFPIPSTFNLNDLQQMSLDEGSGVLGLTFSDGRLWLLFFDGYEDDQFNITTDTLKLMFPEHQGPYSLNRLPGC